MACCSCSFFLLVLFVIAIVALVLLYSGLLFKVDIKLGLPFLINKPVKILYKFGRGPYKHVGPYFSELRDSTPEATLIGIYYDDPEVSFILMHVTGNTVSVIMFYVMDSLLYL